MLLKKLSYPCFLLKVPYVLSESPGHSFYPVIGVALDRCSSSEVDVEVNVLLDLRFIFCTISSAGTGDKPSLPKAGLQQLEAVFCGLFLPDIFPPCAAARWRRCFRCVQYLVYI